MGPCRVYREPRRKMDAVRGTRDGRSKRRRDRSMSPVPGRFAFATLVAALAASCGSVGAKNPDAAGTGGVTTGIGGAAGGGAGGSARGTGGTTAAGGRTGAGGATGTGGTTGAGGSASPDAARDAVDGRLADSSVDAADAPAPSECPGLIGYWPADDDASDKVGNNTGMLQDGVTFARGHLGDAFVFNATSSVVAPRAPGVSALGSWTYSLWINVVSYPNADETYFVDRNSASAPLVDLKASANHFQLLIRYDDGSGLGGPIGGTIGTGTWMHIALVRDAGRQFYLYVDGQNVGSTTDTGGSLTPPPFKLGRHFNSPNGGFSGLIDELKIYDGALTAAQIQSLAGNQACW